MCLYLSYYVSCMSRFVSIPLRMHIVVAQSGFSNISKEPQIVEWCSCEMEVMVQFFMLVQTGQGTDESKSTIGPFFKFHEYLVFWNNYFTTHNRSILQVPRVLSVLEQLLLPPTTASFTIEVECCTFMNVARKVTWLCALLI